MEINDVRENVAQIPTGCLCSVISFSGPFPVKICPFHSVFINFLSSS
jgi:hypothetical protein